MSDREKKLKRYDRIYEQLKELFVKSDNINGRMATMAALLHHKMNFFWTGFYFNINGRLIVQTYQGPLACMVLKDGTGVCHEAFVQGKTIVVPDVDKFPGHIACDSRSKSEIVVPVRYNGKMIAVLDVDSDEPHFFDDADKEGLEKIVTLICE